MTISVSLCMYEKQISSSYHNVDYFKVFSSSIAFEQQQITSYLVLSAVIPLDDRWCHTI